MSSKTKELVLFTIFCTFATGADVFSRIIGGQIAQGSDYPFVVSIRYGRIFNHICGGTIISDYHVLTAAHCLYLNGTKPLNASDLIVVSGNTKLLSTYFYSSNVKEKYVFEKYNETTNDHDIAILKISQPFPFFFPRFNLSTIPLAEKEAKNGTNCTIAGWGYDKYENGSLSNDLKVANVTLLDYSTCKRIYAAGRVYLMDDIICAGDHISDTCQGDSGGPLVCNKTLVGVTSSGVECAHPQYPGIYTDVSKYRHWILKTISNDTFGSFPLPVPVIPPLWIPSNPQNNSWNNITTSNGTYFTEHNNTSQGFHPGSIPSFFPGLFPTRKPSKNSCTPLLVPKFFFFFLIFINFLLNF